MDLKGRKIVITGAFETLSDAEARKLLSDAGAVVVDSVAPDVDFVFAGRDPSGAIDDAYEAGVRVREGADLRALMEGKGSKPAAPEPEVPPEAFAEEMAPPPDFGRIDGFDRSESPAPSGASSSASTAPGERVFEKGARVRIIGGTEGVGQVGDIFWWGDSKFGDGMRAGVTGDDGTKFWVDEVHLAWPDEEIDPEVLEEAKKAAQFRRGDRVKVVSGKESGAEGEIFWWGESKWGDGMRAGIETDSGDKVWVDAEMIEHVQGDDDIPF